ncbi:aquaporin-like protein [Thozetella sp. PMI_491]|nr:aquaporin-like protein [Thozetella sp. PMI_491]
MATDIKGLDPDPQPVRRMSTARGHIVAASGEFVGTLLFLFFSYSGNLVGANQAVINAPGGSKSSETVLFISLAYSFSLLVNVWAMFRISGGHLNPAVTLAMCIVGNCGWIRGAIMIPAQLLGSVGAGLLVSVIFPGRITQANSVLGTGATTVQGFFMETFFTLQLVLVILTLASEKTSRDTSVIIVPVGAGLALFAVMLAGTGFTGGSANPARSFGCAVAGLTFPTYHWIYWLGPGLGAIIAAGYYLLAKTLGGFADAERPTRWDRK